MTHFITTGCSFTAGVIPLPHNRADHWAQQGSVWPHFIFSKMNPAHNKFKNLALPGGGNVAALTNLIYYLETNKSTIHAKNTIVGFNITGHNRLDTICDINNKDINLDLCCIDSSGIDHPSKEMNFGWITSAQSHQQFKIEIASYVAVTQALCYLEQNRFRYFFMIMNDFIYTGAPKWFQTVLDNHKNNWIKFDKEISMYGFVAAHNLCVSDIDRHPSTAGHAKIAEHVDKFLIDNHWYD